MIRPTLAARVGMAAVDPDDIETDSAIQVEFEGLIRRQLELLGEDPTRDGLLKTPSRVAKSMAWLTRGYDLDARQVIGDAMFEESHENMVMVRDIEMYSMCEHHFLPFYGVAHVGYLPDGKIVGLSKLARAVESFARRPQVQERLTSQIADTIEEVVGAKGVGVVIEAEHLCMTARGIRKPGSRIVTSAMRGAFRQNPNTRQEFMNLIAAPQFR